RVPSACPFDPSDPIGARLRRTRPSSPQDHRVRRRHPVEGTGVAAWYALHPGTHGSATQNMPLPITVIMLPALTVGERKLPQPAPPATGVCSPTARTSRHSAPQVTLGRLWVRCTVRNRSDRVINIAHTA